MLCVDSKLASFGAFCEVVTPGGFCPRHRPGPVRLPGPFRRTGASRWCQLAALPFIAATHLHIAPLIRHQEFALRHRFAFVIRHLPFAIWHLPFAIRHLPFAIWHLPFAIWHLAFAIGFIASPSPLPNSAFRIFHSVSSVRCSSRVLADW